MVPPSVKFDRDLLQRPAPEGVRVVALELVADARTAADALADAPSAEALHDFRVALRRLRSWLRAFKRELRGSVAKKDRRALHDVAHATNLGRDVDVQLELLKAAAKGLKPKRRKGADWVAQYLAARQRQAGDPLDAALLREFNKTAARLAERLAEYSLPVARGRRRKPRTLASALASRLPEHMEALASALARVQSELDEAEAHKARIAAKRLRYIVEPVAPFVKKGEAMVETLRTMQFELGQLHDAHLLADEIASAIAQAPTTQATRASKTALGRKPAGGSPGAAHAPRDALLAVASHVGDDVREHYRLVRKHWLRGQTPRLTRDVAAFAKRLAAADR